MQKVKLKKGKITVVITIAIACFALVTVMFMQFKVVNETDITSIETMREEELRTELANWKEKYKEADEQYQEKTAKLQEYKEKEESDTETSQLVQKELEQTNMYLGKTDVIGEGITIKLKDFTDEEGNIQSITAEDLLVIVDYLKSAGAEAISINEQRIVNTSEIVYVGNSIVYINQQRILSPYTIIRYIKKKGLEKMVLLVIIIACLLGAIVGLNAPIISYTYSSYLAIAIVAALDSVFGGIASVINKKFDIKIFISGFFGNAILAILLTVLGQKLNVDIYLAAIVVFVWRMFMNLGTIRRYYVEKWTDKIKNKKQEKNNKENEIKEK